MQSQPLTQPQQSAEEIEKRNKLLQDFERAKNIAKDKYSDIISYIEKLSSLIKQYSVIIEKNRQEEARSNLLRDQDFYAFGARNVIALSNNENDDKQTSNQLNTQSNLSNSKFEDNVFEIGYSSDIITKNINTNEVSNISVQSNNVNYEDVSLNNANEFESRIDTTNQINSQNTVVSNLNDNSSQNLPNLEQNANNLNSENNHLLNANINTNANTNVQQVNNTNFEVNPNKDSNNLSLNSGSMLSPDDFIKTQQGFVQTNISQAQINNNPQNLNLNSNSQNNMNLNNANNSNNYNAAPSNNLNNNFNDGAFESHSQMNYQNNVQSNNNYFDERNFTNNNTINSHVSVNQNANFNNGQFANQQQSFNQQQFINQQQFVNNGFNPNLNQNQNSAPNLHDAQLDNYFVNQVDSLNEDGDVDSDVDLSDKYGDYDYTVSSSNNDAYEADQKLLESQLKENRGLIIRKEIGFLKDINDDYTQFISKLDMHKADQTVALASIRTIKEDGSWLITIPDKYKALANMGFVESFRQNVVNYLKTNLVINYVFTQEDNLPGSPFVLCRELYNATREKEYRDMVSNETMQNVISKLCLLPQNGCFEVVEEKRVDFVKKTFITK